jgi:hypothetical protein
MAFAYYIHETETMGDLIRVTGSFVSSSSGTGGDIATGLAMVSSFKIQLTGAAVVATGAMVNEDLPLKGGVVTIKTAADAAGLFRAEGD